MKDSFKGKNFFKRYKVSKSYKILSLIMFVLAVALFMLSSYKLNFNVIPVDAIEEEKKAYYEEQATWETLKDIWTVLGSTLGINFLLGVCLEKQSKDGAFKEFFTEDIISLPEFYENLPDDKKEKMLHALECNYYFQDNKAKKDMFESITKKLNKTSDKEYYLNKCKFDVVCYIYNDYIEKHIVKTMDVRVNNSKKCVHNFLLLSTSVQDAANNYGVTLDSVEVNGKPVDVHKDLKIEAFSTTSIINKKNGYNNHRKFSLKKVESSKNKPCRIVLKYKTKVAINDLSYVCRMTVPCKKFSLSFEIKNNDEYVPTAYPFGFIDDAKDTPNHDDKSKINVEFDNWIFSGDGVAVFLVKDK